MFLLSLNRLALRLQPLRTAAAVTTGIGWAVMVWILVAGKEEHSLLLRVTLVVTLWSLLLVAFISLFQTLPPPLLPALKWHERLLLRVRIWVFQLMGLMFLALVLSIAGISVKLMLLG